MQSAMHAEHVRRAETLGQSVAERGEQRISLAIDGDHNFTKGMMEVLVDLHDDVPGC